MGQHSKTGLAISVAMVAFGLAGWLYLAPQQLGGSASYVALHGTSMEPDLVRGDLAIVREANAYEVGDVVLYRDPALDTNVLHRIVGRAGGRFVLKGDNNSFKDPARPSAALIVGKLWLRVPVAGRAFAYARTPVNAALLMAAAALLLLGAGFRPRREREEVRAGRRRQAFRPVDPLDSPLVLAFGGAAALFVVLAVAAYGRAPERLASIEGAYKHAGTLSYSGRATPSAVYPRGRLRTGDVVFLKLVDKVDVSFAYRVRSNRPLALHGSAALVAELSDGRGWSRSIPVAPPRAFTGPRATVSGTLDLAALRRLIGDLESLTGSSTFTYVLKLKPRVSFAGRVGESRVHGSFAPALGFSLDAERFQPDRSKPFARTQSGAIEENVANTLTFGPVQLAVDDARWLALVGLLVSIVCGSHALRALRLAAEKLTDEELIEARFGQLLLPVRTLKYVSMHAIDVVDFASLVRLAEHHDSPILYCSESGTASYAIETSSAVYRYGASTAAESLAGATVIDLARVSPPVLVSVESPR